MSFASILALLAKGLLLWVVPLIGEVVYEYWNDKAEG
jgi:hypothetical protein